MREQRGSDRRRRRRRREKSQDFCWRVLSSINRCTDVLVCCHQGHVWLRIDLLSPRKYHVRRPFAFLRGSARSERERSVGLALNNANMSPTTTRRTFDRRLHTGNSEANQILKKTEKKEKTTNRSRLSPMRSARERERESIYVNRGKC